MKRSYLIQRLEKPWGADGPLAEVANLFSFGGGYINGGLSKAAMSMLRNICRFDYMGAAEFEFGAVPAAFNVIATQGFNKELVARQVTLKGHTQQYDENHRGIPGTRVEQDYTVYIICHKDWADEVVSRILGFSAGETGQTKERVGLQQAIHPQRDWDRNICGWLELDNGFIFTIDATMFQRFAEVFGVQPSDTNAITTAA
ncbi:MAG: hypothetical protein EBU46_00335 [Nitrosomonadaceae bacterium]|nr:hypothetical protein [Nitrosomonadaceae bacterium]